MGTSALTQLHAATAGVYLELAEQWASALALGPWPGSSPGAAPDEIALQAFRRGVADTQAVLAMADDTAGATAFLARLADVWRANSFLSLEAALTILESVTRVAPMRGPWQPPGPAWAPRALVIGSVALDIAVGYLALRNRARLQPPLVGTQDWELQHRRGANRLLDLATSLGGLLIKAGQFLATRPDLLPAAYVSTLATLQDRVPPLDYRTIAGVIRHEVGRPLDDVFATVDRHALAAASIAQVHGATLPDGRQVVVKVQYPGMAELVAADLAALEVIVEAIGLAQPTIRLRPLVEYLRGTVPLELDFRREASAMRLLRAALQHRTDVYVPEPIDDLGGERVLVMEYVPGIKITDRAALVAAGIDPTAVARLLNEVYAAQIFRHGILHADPHPGNLLVQSGPRLVLLDHGLTVELSATMRQALAEMVRAVAAGNVEALATALSRVGVRDAERLDIETLLQLVGVLLGGEQPCPETAVGRLGTGLEALPVELILVGRALSQLNGISQQLDPGLDVLELVARFV